MTDLSFSTILNLSSSQIRSLTHTAPIKFRYNWVNREEFNHQYSPERWLLRKIAATAMIAFSSLYFFADLALLIPTIAFDSTLGALLSKSFTYAYTKKRTFILLRDLELSFGLFITIFNDRLGQYLIEDSSFHQNCYKPPQQLPHFPPRSSFNLLFPSLSSNHNTLNQRQFQEIFPPDHTFELKLRYMNPNDIIKIQPFFTTEHYQLLSTECFCTLLDLSKIVDPCSCDPRSLEETILNHILTYTRSNIDETQVNFSEDQRNFLQSIPPEYFETFLENLRNIPSQEFVNIVFSTKNKERYQQRLNILLALAKKTAQETSLSFQRVVNLFRLIIRNFIRRNFSDTQALAHQEQILQALAKEEASFKMAANLFRFIMLSSPFSRLFSVTASAFFSIPITTQRAVFFKSLDGEIVEQIYLRIPDKYKLLITPRQLQDNIALQILFINHIPEEFFPIPVTPEKKAIFQSLNGQTVEQIYSRIPDEYKRLITPRQLNESPVLEALQQSRRFSSRRESSSSHREPSFRVSCPIESYLNTMGISPEDWNTTSDKQQLLSKRYRSLARENHPDKHPNDIERARETMAKINDAYSRLQAHLRET